MRSSSYQQGLFTAGGQVRVVRFISRILDTAEKINHADPSAGHIQLTWHFSQMVGNHGLVQAATNSATATCRRAWDFCERRSSRMPRPQIQEERVFSPATCTVSWGIDTAARGCCSGFYHRNNTSALWKPGWEVFLPHWDFGPMVIGPGSIRDHR